MWLATVNALANFPCFSDENFAILDHAPLSLFYVLWLKLEKFILLT